MSSLEQDTDFYVRFWGTRGSIACAGPDTVKYGGNTSCVEVMCGRERLIFDAGTGIRPLGKKLAAEQPERVEIFLTHTHLDHVIGLPFFVPFHLPSTTSRMYAGHLLPDQTLKQVLSGMMQAPLFPVPPESFRGDVTCIDFQCGDTFTPYDGVTVKTAPLNHPNGAVGYRIEFAGKSICYITDTEHFPEGRDPTIVEFVRDSDVMIYDAMYTEDEYPRFVGFGHSTWQEGVRVADAANVGQLILFHHEPTHDDAFMDQIAKELDAVRPGSIPAQEGLVVRP